MRRGNREVFVFGNFLMQIGIKGVGKTGSIHESTHG